MNYRFSDYRSHYRNLIFLGVPIIVGQLGNIVLNFADTLMIGRHSTLELGAAAFVNNVYALAILVALGFSYAITPVVGRLFGQENTARIGEVMRNAFWANTLVAALLLVVMGVLYLCLDHLEQPKELMPLIKTYFLIQYAGLPFVCWFNTFKQFFDGITDTKTSMWIIISANLLNIFGNWVLIYGKLGLPELGLAGAGLSTLGSRMLMALAVMAIFFLSKRYRPYRLAWGRGRLNKADFVEQNRIGWPLSVQMGLEAAAFGASSIMVGWIGTTSLASHQVMLTISQLGYMVYYGLASAVAVRTSNFTGRKDWHNVWMTSRAGFHLILLLALITCVPIFLYRDIIASLFTENREVQQMVSMMVIPFMIYQFGDGMQCAYANALRGIGYVKPLMGVAFLSYFVVALTLCYLFGIRMGGGIVGLWYSFPIALTLAGVLYYGYFRKGMKRLEKS